MIMIRILVLRQVSFNTCYLVMEEYNCFWPILISICAGWINKISSKILHLANRLSIYATYKLFHGWWISGHDSCGMANQYMLYHKELRTSIKVTWLPCHACSIHFVPSSLLETEMFSLFFRLRMFTYLSSMPCSWRISAFRGFAV